MLSIHPATLSHVKGIKLFSMKETFTYINDMWTGTKVPRAMPPTPPPLGYYTKTKKQKVELILHTLLTSHEVHALTRIYCARHSPQHIVARILKNKEYIHYLHKCIMVDYMSLHCAPLEQWQWSMGMAITRLKGGQKAVDYKGRYYGGLVNIVGIVGARMTTI